LFIYTTFVMKPRLNPYLNFNGNASDAMKFYQSVLGGELTIQTFGESGMSQSDAEKDLVVHATLIAEGINLMASDGRPDMDIKFGDNMHLSLVGEDEKGLMEIFNKLAEGGKIDMSLEKQFWGDTFGMLTDKFGVHWMVNINSEAAH
jgi:PhnB protein